jgi:predicted transcriptional regulator
MSDRELVLDAVQEMPETASLHEIMDEVKKRLAKSERGERGVPHEEAVKMLDSWITK